MISTEEPSKMRRFSGGREPIPLKLLKPYRSYNNERLRDWLGSWASTSKGAPKAHPDELIIRDHLGPQGPGGISMARMESLLSEDIRITDALLQGVVDELRRRKPTIYRNLIPVYFDSFASEGLLEFWRHSDLDEHRIRFEVADRAVDWMLDEAEKSLADLGKKRLVVLAAHLSTDTAIDMVEKERQRKNKELENSGRPDADEAERKQRLALDIYYKNLDEAERQARGSGKSARWSAGEAMRRTTEQTGYTKQWMYKLIESMKAA